MSPSKGFASLSGYLQKRFVVVKSMFFDEPWREILQCDCDCVINLQHCLMLGKFCPLNLTETNTYTWKKSPKCHETILVWEKTTTTKFIIPFPSLSVHKRNPDKRLCFWTFCGTPSFWQPRSRNVYVLNLTGWWFGEKVPKSWIEVLPSQNFISCSNVTEVSSVSKVKSKRPDSVIKFFRLRKQKQDGRLPAAFFRPALLL